MKSFYFLFVLVFISSCASHRSFNNDEIIEYASFQMNCDSSELKITEQIGDLNTVSGCNKTAKFEKMCSLGPCYIVRK